MNIAVFPDVKTCLCCVLFLRVAIAPRDELLDEILLPFCPTLMLSRKPPDTLLLAVSSPHLQTRILLICRASCILQTQNFCAETFG
jgi:hypothetical protein